MSKWENVTAKEYFEKKMKILNSLGRTGGCCDGVSCNVCPLNRLDSSRCSCSGLELNITEEAIKAIMEYEIPVDWSKVPVDTKILVKDDERDDWKHRYFAKFENGRVGAFPSGSTSFSAIGAVTFWEFAKLYEGE